MTNTTTTLPPPSATALQLRQRVSTYDFVTKTFRDDALLFVLGVLFFFACQFGSRLVMNRVSAKFRSLTNEEKSTWCVRFVAAANSLICTFAIPIQLQDGVVFKTAHYDADTGFPSLYEPMPFPQRYFFISLSCYFIYDVIVCVYYRWGAAYTVHGIVSFCGVYCVAWPWSERCASYMGTLFEGCGVWMHGAEMIEALDGPKPLAMGMKGIFSLLFLVIRPIGGTYTAIQFTRQLWIECVEKGFRDIHHPVAPFVVLFVTWGLMALQLYWTKDVLVGVLSTAGIIQERGFGDAKSPTKRKTTKLQE